MKLPEQKIENAASQGQDPFCRDYLKSINLNVEESRLEATTGSILAVTPVDLDPDDVGGLIPIDAIKAARKNGHTIACGETCQAAGNAYARDTMRFPDIGRVIPEPGEVTIVLDLVLLDRLMKAMFTKHSVHAKCPVKLYIKDANSPVRVEPVGSTAHPDSIGVIMPTRA